VVSERGARKLTIGWKCQFLRHFIAFFFPPSPSGKELYSAVIKANLYLNLLSTVTAEQAIPLHSEVEKFKNNVLKF